MTTLSPTSLGYLVGFRPLPFLDRVYLIKRIAPFRCNQRTLPANGSPALSEFLPCWWSCKGPWAETAWA